MRLDLYRISEAKVSRHVPGVLDIVMTASALPRHGPEHTTVLLDGLSEWMARKGFTTVDRMRGLLAVPPGTDEDAHERSGYVRAMRAANRSIHGPWTAGRAQGDT